MLALLILIGVIWILVVKVADDKGPTYDYTINLTDESDGMTDEEKEVYYGAALWQWKKSQRRK